MPRQSHSTHILELARRGAQHRYQELKAELDQLVKHFPDLTKRAGTRISRTVSEGRRVVAAETKEVRQRSWKMSAAARKAISERMRKYWAARRKAAKK